MNLVILGAGGHAREIAAVVMALNSDAENYELLGFVDDDSSKHGTTIDDAPILGDFSWFETIDKVKLRVVCGIGRPSIRYRLVNHAKRKGLSFCSLVHPDASLAARVSIGEGTVVMSKCVLTTDIRLGNHVFIGPGATVSHDTVIQDYVSVYPGVHIAGNVHVGAGCELGIGSSIIQSTKVGEWTIIGAGATVISDQPPNCTAIGTPAKVIQRRDKGWYRV